jgi:hypothetical protein
MLSHQNKEKTIMKTLLSGVLFFILTVPLFGQIPDTLWSKIHDVTDDMDIGKCITQTGDKGYIITGSCDPNGLVSYLDIMLLKTDASGHVMWARTYDMGFFEDGLSVDQTSDGGYIIGGIQLTGVYPFVEDPVSDAWIIKTDPDGDTVWTRRYGGEGNDYCTSLQQTADDGFILTGATNSTACGPNWEINEQTVPDAGRTWLIKTGPGGEVEWIQTFQERSYGNSVIQASDGGYVIAGCIFPDEQSNQSDVLLIKTNESGEMTWTKTIGTEDYDVGFCVKETSDGYVISGQTKPTGQPYNALLIKTGFSGDVIWSKTFGSASSDAAFNVSVGSDGYYCSGATNGIWWVTSSADMWVFKTDFDGNLKWERIYDIHTCDVTYGGTLCDDGGYTVTGMTSYGFGGNLWMAKVGLASSGIKSKEAGSDDVLYQNYPNPCMDETTLSFKTIKPSTVTIMIYDVSGNLVMTPVRDEGFRPGYHSVKINVHHLSGGIYYYQLITDDGYLQTRKMIVQKHI